MSKDSKITIASDIQTLSEETGNTSLSLNISSRFWTFTIWIHDFRMEKEIMEKKNMNFIIFQIEQCPKTKKLHYQGYIEFTRAVNLRWMSTNFGKSNHYERARGSGDDNITYCSKKETRVDGPWSIGTSENKGQGQRNDLINIKNDLKEGKDMNYIGENYAGSYIRYHKGIEKLQQLLIKERRNWRPELIVFIGPPGTGKTKRAFDENEDKTIYNKPDCSQWWDGYDGQEVVVINEFKGQLPMEFMNNLADYYPMQVQIKGGYKKFTSKKIYITSNIELDKWWTENNDSFYRRITTFSRFFPEGAKGDFKLDDI